MSDIDKLRAVLFDTLEGVKAGTIDLDQAKSINEVSQTIINSAKAEIDFARVNGSVDSKFFSKPGLPNPQGVPAISNEKEVTQTLTGTLERDGAVTTHRIN